jgi:hypothetical protein
MTGDEERSLLVVIEPEDVDYVRGLADQHGLRVDEIDVRGLEPVSTVTLALLGAATLVSCNHSGVTDVTAVTDAGVSA